MQHRLLRIRGFLPYLFVVLVNAIIDLGHKIIIQNTVFKCYDGSTQIALTALVNACILLPFIVFFTPAGFLADRFAKNVVIRYTAGFAIPLTVLIYASYLLGWFEAAFALTLILAAQSAFYSPAKYGYIKEMAGKDNLGMANGVVQAVTIIAILLGGVLFSVVFEALIGQVQTREDILRWFGKARLSFRTLENARSRLIHEVLMYHHYLTGECYLYEIEDANGKVVDICGGFLGDIKICEEEAKAAARATLKDRFPLLINQIDPKTC